MANRRERERHSDKLIELAEIKCTDWSSCEFIVVLCLYLEVGVQDIFTKYHLYESHKLQLDARYS